jgi:hypothetical protein
LPAVHNEQTKILATALNDIAVAYVVVGFVTPITAVSFGVTSAPPLRAATVFFATIWLCTAISLHWLARRVLRSLKR